MPEQRPLQATEDRPPTSQPADAGEGDNHMEGLTEEVRERRFTEAKDSGNLNGGTTDTDQELPKRPESLILNLPQKDWTQNLARTELPLGKPKPGKRAALELPEIPETTRNTRG